jgi:hypothetical protein
VARPGIAFPSAPFSSTVEPCTVANSAAAILALAPKGIGTGFAASPPSAMVVTTSAGSGMELNVMQIAVASGRGLIRNSTKSAAALFFFNALCRWAFY